MSKAVPFSRLEHVLVVALGLFLLFLAVNGALHPAAAAKGFGIAIASPDDLFYLLVKADRDFASALAVFTLWAFGGRRALALFLTVAVVQPVCDAALSIADPRGHLGYALAVHGSAAVYTAVVAGLLWWRGKAAASPPLGSASR